MWRVMGLVAVLLLVYRGTEANCRYEFNVPASDVQCSAHSQELEANVNRLETRQNLNDGRQQSMADAFKSEMSTLSEDTRASKLVIDRLVEDTATFQGKLHVLQDVGLEVRALRSRLLNTSDNLAGRVSGLQERVLDVMHSLDQATNGQVLVTSRMKGAMDAQTATISQFEAKIAALEQRLADRPSTSSVVEDLQGMVNELTSKVNTLTDRLQRLHIY